MNRRKKEMKIKASMLFVITLLLWGVLFLVKLAVWGLDGQNLIEEIISNMLGIIPPLLIFDFGLEYLTRDDMADEVSEKIVQTLMGESDAIDVFKDEDKVKFVKNTVTHLVGEESSMMVNEVIDPYITNKYNIKTYFKYSIVIRNYINSDIFSEDKYMKVYEDLKYKRTFIGNNRLSKEINIAFIMKDHALDDALRSLRYIFQENFAINETEFERLCSLTDLQLIDFVSKEMQLTLYIDNNLCEIRYVKINLDALIITLISEHDVEMEQHNVELSFSMPQSKKQSEILISINEPTYSPLIQLSYPESNMNVKVYSFLNAGCNASVTEASHNIGTYEFCIQDKWIYPMSGVVFVINEN